MKTATFYFLYFCTIFSVCLLGTGCDSPAVIPQVKVLHGNTMGTTFEIRLGELPEKCDLTKLSKDIELELKSVTRQMSTWEADSEITKFNQSTSTDWFDVSLEFAQVVSRAIDYHRQTDGKFDITIPPLLDIWNFGHKEQEVFTPPTLEQITAAKELVNSSLIEARLDLPAIRKLKPEIRIEVSAIAQGHGIDRICKVLDLHLLQNYMVEIGGEIVVKGHKPEGTPWRIAIEKPVDGKREIETILELTQGAVGTSGNYRHQSVDTQGNTYSHIIDPATGRPVEHQLQSVSIYTELSSMDADALTTSLMVMGPEMGYNWAESHQLAALFVSRQPDGQLVTKRTTAFEKLKEVQP